MNNLKTHTGADVQGIYTILNTANGKRYVGSALHIRKRWGMHRHYLRKGEHHCQHLQRAWDKHGADAFQWEVLEEVSDLSKLVEREQYWIDHYRAKMEGVYNVRVVAWSNAGYVQSPEVRLKHSIAGFARRHSEETKKKISLVKRGEVRSDAFKQGVSEALRKRIRKPETGQAISRSKLGRPNSENHRRAVSLARKGKPASEAWHEARRNSRPLTDDEIHTALMRFDAGESILAIAKAMRIPYSTVRRKIKNRRD